MCDNCQNNEIRVRGLKLLLNEIRQILSIEDGQSVVKAVKDLKETIELKNKEIEKFQTPPERMVWFTRPEKEMIMELIERLGVDISTRESFKSRIRKIIPEAYANQLDLEEVEFIKLMQSRGVR